MSRALLFSLVGSPNELTLGPGGRGREGRFGMGLRRGHDKSRLSLASVSRSGLTPFSLRKNREDGDEVSSRAACEEDRRLPALRGGDESHVPSGDLGPLGQR